MNKWRTMAFSVYKYENAYKITSMFCISTLLYGIRQVSTKDSELSMSYHA